MILPPPKLSMVRFFPVFAPLKSMVALGVSCGGRVDAFGAGLLLACCMLFTKVAIGAQK